MLTCACSARLNGERDLRRGRVVEIVGYLHGESMFAGRQAGKLYLIAFFRRIRKHSDGKYQLPVARVKAVLRARDRTGSGNRSNETLRIKRPRPGAQILDSRRSIGNYRAIAFALAPLRLVGGFDGESDATIFK